MGEDDEFDDEFDDDEFNDEFDDVDDAALIEAAAQVEARLQSNSSMGAIGRDFTSSTSQQQWSQPSRVAGGPLKQTTLTGAVLNENVRPTPPQRQYSSFSSSGNRPGTQTSMTRNRYPLVENQNQEPPTHHRLDFEAAKTWVYPSNMGHRDYQFNIVQAALYNNLLVALPTGLGKTFIAAVVMLNWYRWAPDGHLLFLAPTKPLVEQQIDACYTIAGIPRRQTIELTGKVARKIRAEYWEERRVFFGTPQTIENDLKYGLADPKKIVCVVIDEAHRATGNFAYVKVVQFIRKFNSSFRVLALTATPGSKVESIQEVIDSLGIARIEIRTEESLDIRPYTFKKHIEEVVIELSPELDELKELYVGCMQPFLDELRSKKATFLVDAEKLQLFTLVNAKNEWQKTLAAQNLPAPAKWAVLNIYSLLISLAHPFSLLIYHGIRSFYSNITAVRNELEGSKGKMKDRLFSNPKWKTLLKRAEEIMASPTFIDHPKLEYLVGALLRHFLDCEERGETSTRVIIFSSFRGSAEEIVRALKQHEPKIKPHMFVGQQDSKNGQSGMNQGEQQRVIQKFKDGIYNTLVATSIGEEGLDIGEVDLIVCYDSSASPIRMLQRMGRTGRKREGNIILLLTKGKEEDAYMKAKDNYNQIQKKIISGEAFRFDHQNSPRILPREIVPIVDKRHITPPVEAPETKKQRGKKKLPPKKFHMPDGVDTGFIKASRIGKKSIAAPSDDEEVAANSEAESLAPNYPDTSSKEGLLNEEQERHLQKHYMQTPGYEEEITIVMPRMDAFPEFQRDLSSTKFVGHGRATKSMVEMLHNLRKYEDDPTRLEALKDNFREEDLVASEDYDSPPPVNQQASKHSGAGWRFGNILKHKFIPKPKPTVLAEEARRKSPYSPLSALEDESDVPVIDIMSSAESAVNSSPSRSSSYDEENIIEVTETDVEEDIAGDSDDDDLPEPSDILQHFTTPARKRAASEKRGVARKKLRIEDSDEDEGG